MNLTRIHHDKRLKAKTQILDYDLEAVICGSSMSSTYVTARNLYGSNGARQQDGSFDLSCEARLAQNSDSEAIHDVHQLFLPLWFFCSSAHLLIGLLAPFCLCYILMSAGAKLNIQAEAVTSLSFTAAKTSSGFFTSRPRSQMMTRDRLRPLRQHFVRYIAPSHLHVDSRRIPSALLVPFRRQ